MLRNDELQANWTRAQVPSALEAVEPLQEAVGMVELARVVEVVTLGGRRLRVTFSDDLVRELDFAGALSGVLSSIDEDAAFAGAAVDAIAGTVCWPGGLDLDPDVLHGAAEAASGPRPVLIREYRLQQAG